MASLYASKPSVTSASKSVPQSVSSSSGGDWTPYGSVTPAGGIDLLRQSVQWNTEEQMRQAQLSKARLGMAGGGVGGGGTSRAGGGSAGGYPAGSFLGMAESRRQKSALGDLAKQYTSGYGGLQTEAAQRYQQMLGVIGQTTGQREADIRQDYFGREADMMQGLARSGMAGTTIAPTMGLGVERGQQSSLNRLADLMQTQKLGVMGARAGELGRLGEAGLRGKLGVQQMVAMMPGR